MNFRIGQRVVCIGREWFNCETGIIPPNLPVYGNVYTVKGIYELADVIYIGVDDSEETYEKAGFRPVVTKSNKQSRQAIIDSLKEINQPVDA